MQATFRLGLLAVLLLPAGCGQAPTPTAPRPSAPAALPPQVLPAPGISVPGAEPARVALQSLVTAMDGTTSFEARYVNEEQANGERRKSTYKMKFQQRPRISLLEVVESTQIPAGFKVRDTGGDKVRVRLPGAVSFIKMDVPARSSQSRSLMGLYPDQITPDRFVAMMLDPGSQLREVPGRVVAGRPLRCFEAIGPKAPLPGATVTLGLGEGPAFSYYLALKRPNGANHVQTFAQLKVRAFTTSELDL